MCIFHEAYGTSHYFTLEQAACHSSHRLSCLVYSAKCVCDVLQMELSPYCTQHYTSHNVLIGLSTTTCLPYVPSAHTATPYNQCSYVASSSDWEAIDAAILWYVKSRDNLYICRCRCTGSRLAFFTKFFTKPPCDSDHDHEITCRPSCRLSCCTMSVLNFNWRILDYSRGAVYWHVLWCHGDTTQNAPIAQPLRVLGY